MREVEFIKNYAGFKKGDRHSFEGQHAFKLVQLKVAKVYVVEPVVKKKQL